MEDIQKRIEEVEKEIRETPYHKGTEHHIGKLRAKIAKLKDQVIERQSKKSGGGGGGGFSVKQQGDATVVLVGFPSVGKSTLLNKLTNAKSPTAEYAFTTLTVIPGMMEYKGARILVLDVPGIVEGAASGKGRGREVLSVIRGADLLLIMTSAGKENAFEKINEELSVSGIRLNKEPPKVVVKKTTRGGIEVRSSTKQDFELSLVKEVAKEFGYANAEVYLYQKLTLEELIDAFARNRVYVPALYTVNKTDLYSPNQLQKAKESNWIGISAEEGVGLEDLREAFWNKLGLIRVYLKKTTGITDYEEPLIMRSYSTLNDVLYKIGNDFAETKSEARIWGPGAKYPGQKVSLSASIQDQIEVMFE